MKPNPLRPGSPRDVSARRLGRRRLGDRSGPHPRPSRGGWRSDTGSAAIEVVLVTPLIMMLVGLAVYAGRTATTQQDIISASRDAARAAAARQYPGPAATDGRTAAETTLRSRGVSCRGLIIEVDTTRLVPGGSVTATVRCNVELSDVTGLLGLPGSTELAATSTAVVDRYRGGD